MKIAIYLFIGIYLIPVPFFIWDAMNGDSGAWFMALWGLVVGSVLSWIAEHSA